ncbi:MAG: hypothetical protein ACREJB_18570, partial [Planctomycetaceae bacterium]
MRKLLQRHRAAVLITAAFALLLFVGIIISTWQAVVARRAEQTALTLKSDAEQARLAESEARKQAELQAFIVQLNQRVHEYENAADMGGERLEFYREKLLALAGLLQMVPEHAPAWRDHLIMTVLLAGRDVAPSPILPERPSYDIRQAALSSDGRRIVTATADGTLQVRDFPSLKSRTVCRHDGFDLG